MSAPPQTIAQDLSEPQVNAPWSDVDVPPDDLVATGASHEVRSGYKRTSDSINRMPSPPAIRVPPCYPFKAISTDLPLGTPRPYAAVDVTFLEDVDYGHLFQYSAGLDWDYSDRRKAQKILPFIYLGPMAAAKDRAFLQEEGITMLFAVRNSRTSFSKIMSAVLNTMADSTGLDRGDVEVGELAQLVSILPQATLQINQHMARISALYKNGAPGCPAHGKVLVFCETGNGASAAIVVAYIMEMYQSMEVVNTCQLVLARRFCCHLDDQLRYHLESYRGILEASRVVAASGAAAKDVMTQTTWEGITRKRMMTADGDEDEDTGDAWADRERFEGRMFVPFEDDDV